MRALLVLTAASIAACVDLGEPPLRDAEVVPEDSGEKIDAGACTEGVVDSANATHTINIIRFDVDPRVIRVRAGDVVSFSNTDTRNHRFVSGTPEAPILPEQGGFNTGAIPQAQAYGHRFCTPRTIVYYCSSHPGTMHGYEIVIE